VPNSCGPIAVESFKRRFPAICLVRVGRAKFVSCPFGVILRRHLVPALICSLSFEPFVFLVYALIQWSSICVVAGTGVPVPPFTVCAGGIYNFSLVLATKWGSILPFQFDTVLVFHLLDVLLAMDRTISLRRFNFIGWLPKRLIVSVSLYLLIYGICEGLWPFTSAEEICALPCLYRYKNDQELCISIYFACWVSCRYGDSLLSFSSACSVEFVARQ
jgi:hypothetical protein